MEVEVEKCYVLIPQFDFQFCDEEGECELPHAHGGYHLNKLKGGGYLSWGGNGCDESCEWCGECFNYFELSPAQARVILADPKKLKVSCLHGIFKKEGRCGGGIYSGHIADIIIIQREKV